MYSWRVREKFLYMYSWRVREKFLYMYSWRFRREESLPATVEVWERRSAGNTEGIGEKNLCR